MIISSHNSGKVTEERKFIFVVCREGVGSNSIFCQFCWCWVRKIFVDIRGKLKQVNKFKCRANQQTETIEEFASLELNGLFFEIGGKVCLKGKVGARRVCS